MSQLVLSSHELASFSSIGFEATIVLEKGEVSDIFIFQQSHVVIGTFKINFWNADSLAYYFCSEVEWFYPGFIQVLSISISAIVMILMVLDENLRFSFCQVYTHANYVAYAMLFT